MFLDAIRFNLALYGVAGWSMYSGFPHFIPQYAKKCLTKSNIFAKIIPTNKKRLIYMKASVVLEPLPSLEVNCSASTEPSHR